MAGSIQDISERRQAVEALKAEEQLLRRLLDVQEKERRMVAYDIHDGFVQDVVGAHIQVQRIHAGLESDALQEIVDAATSLLSKAITEGRRMIHDLRPMILDEAGVIEAVTHLVAEEQKQADLSVDFQHNVQFGRLEPKLEGSIYRIVQEALNNVKQHGQTDTAVVQMIQADGLLYVVIRDEGVGFDPTEVSAEHLGLRGIRERARLSGGMAKIDSAPGEGTTVSVQLRLDDGLLADSIENE
jgi:signal transduction histidine kinase